MSAPLFVLCLALSLHIGLSTESLKAEDGYEVFPAFPWSRYKMPVVRANWTAAFSFCENDSGDSHLVVINSVQEAEVVKELVNRLGHTPWAWVGINDLATEGLWRTVQGGLVAESGYDKWGPEQPKGSTDFNCGYVIANGLYYDYPCYFIQNFICEKVNA